MATVLVSVTVIGFVTGAFNLFAAHPVHFIETDLNLLLHCQGKIERHGRHCLNQQFADGLVDLLSVDALTERLSVLNTIFLADIVRNRACAAAVIAHCHSTAANATEDRPL